MYQTRLTELLGIEHPIIGGCMMHISRPEFVASISNAGGLGMMASAMFPTREEFLQAVRTTKELTHKPFGVNLSLFPALRKIDNDIYVEVILEEEVPVVETSGRKPPAEMIARLKGEGVIVMHKCTTVQHALSAQNSGVDAVTVFGSEGGGHIGENGLATFVIVPRVVDELDIPVVAAGGISDGRGLLSALALGADGITIGTRLLVTEECPIHPNVKQALLEATELDTLEILGTLHNTLRAWKNKAALAVADMEEGGDAAKFGEILSLVAGTETKRLLQKGEVEAGVIACGQGIGLVSEIKPVAEVVQGMVKEAAAIQEQLYFYIPSHS